MISYKHYSSEEIPNFIKDRAAVNETFSILMQYLTKIQNFTSREVSLFKKDLLKKNTHLFLVKSDSKIVGVCQGNLKNKSFFINNLYIHPDFQNKGLGRKLKLRVTTFMSSKYNVEKIESGTVISKKIYSINEDIVNRRNKSSKKEYSLEKKSEMYIDKFKKIKPKTNILIKKHGRK